MIPSHTQINTLEVSFFLLLLLFIDLKKGQLCGEIEFFSQKVRNFTAKSLTYSKAFVIYLNDFEKILETSKTDFVIYFIIHLMIFQKGEISYS